MVRVLGFMLLVGMLFATKLGGTAANAQADEPSKQGLAKEDLAKETAAGVTKLQSWYMPSTGLYATTQWWNAANAITVLADDAAVSGSRQFDSVFRNTFQQAPLKYPGFLNDFYDDEGWWALAWIAAFDDTHEQRYLDAAVAIFHDMAGGWDNTCGGGIWWSKERKYKNAIANELFLSVAAHLATRVAAQERATALSWANREWAWFQTTGMMDSQNLIHDGLTAECKSNGRTAWTYNQGVVLGGLVALFRAQGDPQLLASAHTIARAAIAKLSDTEGVLHDAACEPKCGADGVQFKGVFLRNLADLQGASPRASYVEFAKANAHSLWTRSRDAQNAFGQVWSGPFDAENAASQASALDAFVAAWAMTRQP